MSIEALRTVMKEYDQAVAERDRLRQWLNDIVKAMNLSPAIPSRYIGLDSMRDIILAALRDADFDAPRVADEAREREIKALDRERCAEHGCSSAACRFVNSIPRCENHPSPR